jgi:hypothetical protein
MSADTEGGLDPDSPLGRFANPTCASSSDCAHDVDEPGQRCASCAAKARAQPGSDDGAGSWVADEARSGYRAGGIE